MQHSINDITRFECICLNAFFKVPKMFQRKTKPSRDNDSECSMPYLLTLWGRDKMAAIFQTTFSNRFSWMKMYGFRLTFHWSLFLGVQLTIFQYWSRWWLGADQATSHYLNQWWLDYRRMYASLGLNELSTWFNFIKNIERDIKIMSIV